MTGLDLSHWNKNPDFKKIKNAGHNFVILKCGGSDNGLYTDPCFVDYYKKATKVGLHVGVYFFAGKNFTTEAQALKCAKYVYKLISGKKLDMPIYLDIETTPTTKVKETTQACIKFLEYLENKKCFVGLYGSDLSTYKDRVDYKALTNYTFWVARYGKEPEYVKNYDMWQKSETGTCAGVNGNVDIDVCTANFPSVIKNKHLNGY